jgi:hypothetical protein
VYEDRDRATVRDIKQQSVALVALDALGRVAPARIEAFVRGGWNAVGAWLAAVDSSSVFEPLVPCDLFDRRVLELARPKTDADFAAAVGKRLERLGRSRPRR